MWSSRQSWDSALDGERCWDVAARNKKRGHGSHRSPFLRLKLCLPLNLIRFWYQAFFLLCFPSSSTCVKLQRTIYYLFPLICLLFLMDAFVRAPAALLLVIRRSASSPSLLRPSSSAGLSLTHLLALVRELWIFFFLPFHPMTARWGAMRAGC